MKKPEPEPKDEAGSAKKMAVSLLTKLSNLERKAKGISFAVTGDEAIIREPDLPPKALNEILADALRTVERVMRTTNHVADKLGVGE